MKKPSIPQALEQSAQAPAARPEAIPPKRVSAAPEKASDSIGVKFYITTELDAALDRRAYRDRNRNRSAHIRAALEAYLAEDLEAIRSGRC